MCAELARPDLDLEAFRSQIHPVDSSGASGSLICRHRRMTIDCLRTGPVPGCGGHGHYVVT